MATVGLVLGSLACFVLLRAVVYQAMEAVDTARAQRPDVAPPQDEHRRREPSRGQQQAQDRAPGERPDAKPTEDQLLYAQHDELMAEGRRLYREQRWGEAKAAFEAAKKACPRIPDPDRWLAGIDEEKLKAQAADAARAAREEEAQSARIAKADEERIARAREAARTGTVSDFGPPHLTVGGSDNLYEQVQRGLDIRDPIAGAWWRRAGEIQDTNLPPDLEDALLRLNDTTYELERMTEEIERQQRGW